MKKSLAIALASFLFSILFVVSPVQAQNACGVTMEEIPINIGTQTESLRLRFSGMDATDNTSYELMIGYYEPKAGRSGNVGGWLADPGPWKLKNIGPLTTNTFDLTKSLYPEAFFMDGNLYSSERDIYIIKKVPGKNDVTCNVSKYYARSSATANQQTACGYVGTTGLRGSEGGCTDNQYCTSGRGEGYYCVCDEICQASSPSNPPVGGGNNPPPGENPGTGTSATCGTLEVVNGLSTCKIGSTNASDDYVTCQGPGEVEAQKCCRTTSSTCHAKALLCTETANRKAAVTCGCEGGSLTDMRNGSKCCGVITNGANGIQSCANPNDTAPNTGGGGTGTGEGNGTGTGNNGSTETGGNAPVEDVFFSAPTSADFKELNPLKNNPTLSSPGGIISRILLFAFPLAGLILFAMLVWGGFEMLVGATGKGIDAGKQRVTNAIIGFFLLFVSYWVFQIVEIIFGLQFI